MPAPLDVLRSPLPTLNLADRVEFQQIQLRGVSLSVDVEARARIAAALQVATSQDAADAVPHLIEMLGQDRISGNTGDLVARFSSGNATTADGLQLENMSAYAEADLACQVTAQDALTRIGQPVIDALQDALLSPLANRRVGAAKVLGAIGPAAQGALPMLKELARGDREETVRKAAAEAVSRLKPKRWFGF
jgi:HEAT repeats